MDEMMMTTADMPTADLPVEEPVTTKIGQKEVELAFETLQKYKRGKANLENRVVEDELWWEMRHWEVMRKQNKFRGPEPSSAWLFNSIMNRHADAMDNYPEPVVLPRERSDEQSAKMLTAILPTLLEYNNFESVYSDNWWEKLKHGTAAYGVFWDTQKENGLGDVDIRGIDLLKMFWEPGITNIQDSQNFFIVDLVDRAILEDQYPDKKGRFNGNSFDVREYIYQDDVDNTDKALVVDWYYKKSDGAGRTILHYCKFCNGEVLYASENTPEYAERGYYDHGKYPVVFDTLWPEKGTPVGFGLIAIAKDTQMYIDKLGNNIMETSLMGTKKRYLISDSTNINEDEFLDWNKPMVHVSGQLDDSRIRPIDPTRLDAIYVNVMNMKTDELKETTGNRDVNSGGTSSGITAGAAIAALQEAGNKSSRDQIRQSYRAITDLTELVIELLRQFYDEARSFRITGTVPGQVEFQDFSNAGIRPQLIGVDSMGGEMFRTPVFDLKISAQKKNPFSRIEMNELAKNLYAAGFFNPDRATEAMVALNMMDFESIEKVKEQVNQGNTLMNICKQMAAQMDQMAQMLGMAPEGAQPGVKAGQPSGNTNPGPVRQNVRNDLASGVMETQAPRTSYQQKLAERSKPSVD